MPLLDSERQIFSKAILINKTTAISSLLEIESSAFVSNLGAVVDVVINLPFSPFDGIYYQFNISAASKITIGIEAPSVFAFTDSMGIIHSYSSISSDVVGSTIFIQGAHNNVWYIIGMTGIWDTTL